MNESLLTDFTERIFMPEPSTLEKDRSQGKQMASQSSEEAVSSEKN